jgi:hypothetical protein
MADDPRDFLLEISFYRYLSGFNQSLENRRENAATFPAA